MQIHTHLVSDLYLHHSILLGDKVVMDGESLPFLLYIKNSCVVAVDVGNVGDFIADVCRRGGGIDVNLHTRLYWELKACLWLREVSTQTAGSVPAVLVLQQDAVHVVFYGSVAVQEYGCVFREIAILETAVVMSPATS